MKARMIDASALRCQLLLVLLGLSLPACGDDALARPDVLIVVIDTLRSDHCSLYGYGPNTTPQLDALAAGGVTCELAYSPTSTTCPSHATLFTARHPGTHGLVRNGLVLAQDELTLAELALRNGYRTAAFVSSFPVSHEFGFDQGFEHFDDCFDRADGSFPMRRWNGRALGSSEGFDRTPAATTDAALHWLENQEDVEEPILMWVHLFDPHAPWEPPEVYAEQFVPASGTERELDIGRYDAEVASSDAQLGRLAAAFSARDDALIVVTSDHGEGLWDHGWRSHDRSVYEEEVRVPLVFSWPGKLPGGQRVSTPVHLVDVAVTVASAIGLVFDGVEIQGRDLMQALKGETAGQRDRPVFLSRPYWPDGREKYDELGRCLAVRQGRWKYIEAPEEGRRELYDLEQDPAEQHNLVEQHADVAARLSGLLADWAEHSWRVDDTQAGELSPALRALGYVGSEPRDQ
jgi:arylsulfatase A-like enzyme